MTNQAAQTIPELPEPAMRELNPYHGSRIDPYAGATHLQWYTADQMHQYARDYAAALSQTAGVVLARGWFHALPDEDDYEFHDDASGAGKNCDGCIRAVIVAAPAASGGEDGALNLRGDETNQEVLVEFIRVCREAKPVGQWPGERVCRAIENLMNGPRDFISPDDRSPLRFGVGRGNEGGRLGLMGRDLAQPQHDAAGGAKCIWPDCGHDTNRVGYSIGCTGAYCPVRNSTPAASVSERTRALPSVAAFASAVWRDWMTNEQADKLGAELHAWLGAHIATTPQPSADAVRELVRKWRGIAETNFAQDRLDKVIEISMDNTLRDCADELESLLSGGSHA